MGGGPSFAPQTSTGNAQSALAQEQIQLGQEIFGQSQQQLQEYQKLTQPLENYYKDILSANSTGNYSTLINAAGVPLQQLSQSKQASAANIQNTIAPGAGQDYALATNEQQGNTAIAQAIGQIYSGAAPALASIGSGAAQVGLQETGGAISSLGGAGSSLAGASTTFGNVANQQEQGKSSLLSFFGELAGAAGTGAGLAVGRPGCWIAEAIYGVDDPRTFLVRSWLNGPFKESSFGRFVMRFYLRFGERVAERVKKSAILRRIFKVVFDIALRKAARWYDPETYNCSFLGL